MLRSEGRNDAVITECYRTWKAICNISKQFPAPAGTDIEAYEHRTGTHKHTLGFDYAMGQYDIINVLNIDMLRVTFIAYILATLNALELTGNIEPEDHKILTDNFANRINKLYKIVNIEPMPEGD
jgi:hypothetical protein